MPWDSVALHRTIIAVDVAGYNHPMRTLAHQLAVHEGFYGLLHAAFAGTGIPWDSCFVENTGDGAMILLPPEIAKADLVAELPERILAGLRRHNAVHSAEATVQLRVALHAGEVRQASHGSVSQAVSFTFRLLEAPEVKAALKQSGAELALIVSDTFYADVVKQDPAAVPESFRQIRVEVKETVTEGWLRLLGAPETGVTMSVSASRAELAPVSFPALIEALLAVPCVRNAETRRLLLEMFPRQEIAEAVAHHPEDRMHVIALARTCQRYEGGFDDLLVAVRLLDPASPQVENLATMIAKGAQYRVR